VRIQANIFLKALSQDGFHKPGEGCFGVRFEDRRKFGRSALLSECWHRMKWMKATFERGELEKDEDPMPERRSEQQALSRMDDEGGARAGSRE
jgi:hypothetical protein